jgi:hypothetical protein
MCNTRTGVALELVAPFMVESCQECGHIHSIVDETAARARARRLPLVVPTCCFPDREAPT